MTDDDKARAIGGVSGLGVIIGGVALGGPVAGLGMTGITSGLAAVGGLVGGSMLAGIVLVAVVPVSCAVAAPSVYRLAKSRLSK
jgi:hypothetical protein